MACLTASSLRTGALQSSACRARLVFSRPAIARPTLSKRSVLVRAQDTETDTQVEVDKYIKDLQEKWDRVENKTSVVLYGAGALVLVWFSSTLVSALNSIPLVPKVLELVGLGYTSWFVYRYLLFKSSREELVRDVEELKKRITGDSDL
eukprot:GHRR01029675.1.p1 GENE.GHRR01029675.1~~GHRR01029675.1.p1  ORF type:complete len:149 (-),score=44.43 GHRR01029675.1:567-1013(-)